MQLPVNNAHRQTLEMAGQIQGASRRPTQNCANGSGIPRKVLGRSFGCSEKFPVELRVQFAFKPVDPVILPKYKALQTGITTLCRGRSET